MEVIIRTSCAATVAETQHSINTVPLFHDTDKQRFVTVDKGEKISKAECVE